MDIQSPVPRWGQSKVSLKRRVESLVGGDADLLGCTEAEVAEIVEANGTFDPDIFYVEFMRQMGVRGGGLFLGTDVYYPRCLGALEGIGDVFPEGDLRKIFIFGHHQGYQTYFFRKFDSAVYLRTEFDFGVEEQKLSPSFFDFLENEFNSLVGRMGGLG